MVDDGWVDRLRYQGGRWTVAVIRGVEPPVSRASRQQPRVQGHGQGSLEVLTNMIDRGRLRGMVDGGSVHGGQWTVCRMTVDGGWWTISLDRASASSADRPHPWAGLNFPLADERMAREATVPARDAELAPNSAVSVPACTRAMTVARRWGHGACFRNRQPCVSKHGQVCSRATYTSAPDPVWCRCCLPCVLLTASWSLACAAGDISRACQVGAQPAAAEPASTRVNR